MHLIPIQKYILIEFNKTIKLLSRKLDNISGFVCSKYTRTFFQAFNSHFYLSIIANSFTHMPTCPLVYAHILIDIVLFFSVMFGSEKN